MTQTTSSSELNVVEVTSTTSVSVSPPTDTINHTLPWIKRVGTWPYYLQYRYFFFLVVAFQVFSYSGILFGWGSMSLILREDGAYSGLCPDKSQPSCDQQDQRLQLLFTIGSVCFNISGIVIGVFVDYFGARLSVISVTSSPPPLLLLSSSSSALLLLHHFSPTYHYPHLILILNTEPIDSPSERLMGSSSFQCPSLLFLLRSVIHPFSPHFSPCLN